MTGILDGTLASSAVPNLHALAIHFPIALLATALLIDIACVVLSKVVWLDRTAMTLYVLGTLSAAAAYLTGQTASGNLGLLSTEVRTALADHHDIALITLLAYCIVVVLRGIVAWLGREDWRIKFGFFRLLALVASAAALVLLALTTNGGSALVYQYGVGASAAATTITAPPTEATSP